MRPPLDRFVLVLLMAALVACVETTPPPERVRIAEIWGSRLVSSGETLFVASETPDGVAIHELRGGELVHAFTIPFEGDDTVRALGSLVATHAGELYWSYASTSGCVWSCVSTEPDRVGRWDGTEVRWIDVPGGVHLEAYEDDVWAQARDGDEQALFRIEGERAIEIRRDAFDENVYLYAVLPSGHAVRTTRAFEAAEEIDLTGAVVGPFPWRTRRYARDGWTITAHQDVIMRERSRITFARDGTASVTAPLRGGFAGAGPGSVDGLDWIYVTGGIEGYWSNGDAIVSTMFVVEHFDGTRSIERFRTEWVDLDAPFVVHGGSLFYVDEGALYEQPLR